MRLRYDGARVPARSTMTNVNRLGWAVRTKQSWQLIHRVEGCTYQEYRAIKDRQRAERRQSSAQRSLNAAEEQGRRSSGKPSNERS